MLVSRKTLGALAVVAGVVAWAASAQPRELPEVAVDGGEPPAPVEAPTSPVHARRGFRRRLATSFVFVVLFCAGGALAAGAGNVLVTGETAAPVPEPTTDVVTTTDEPTTTEEVVTTTATTTTVEEAVPTTTDEAVATTTEEPPPVEAAPLEPMPVAVETTPEPVAPAPAPTRPVVHAPRRVAAPAPVVPTIVSPFPVIAFDPQAWLAENPGTPVGNAAVAIAMHYLGVPYRWGGNAPSTGFDCSGLTQFVYAQLGIWLPHYAAAQFLAYRRLAPAQLQPGDLVFFEPKADGPGHTAIYAGHGTIIEAPHTGATVRVGSLSGAAAALGFLGAVRPTATPLARQLAVKTAGPARQPGGTWFVAA